MPESVSCNLCGSADSETLYTAKDYRFFTDDIEWPVVRCRRCGLGYLNPRPTAAEIGDYYPTRYFGHRGSLTKRYERQAAYLPVTPGALLDIGTAAGDFLLVMKLRGWQVEGIEPFDHRNPHELTIHRFAFPEHSDLSGGRFDVITAWAVFEHFANPLQAFKESARLLRPAGTLIVQVPNLVSLRGRFTPMEDVPRHLHFFSPSTLREYGRRAGLELESVHHVTHLFSGASGREACRYWTARCLGNSPDQFFRIYHTSRGERFRRWPATASALAIAGVAGRALVPDWFVRTAHISGEIVAVFRRSGGDGPV